MRAGGVGGGVSASGGSGDPADTLAPHFIGGNCEISSSGTCRGPFVRPHSGPWMVFTFHLHSLPLPPPPPAPCVTHLFMSNVTSRRGGRREGRPRAVGRGRSRKVILLTSAWPTPPDGSAWALWRNVKWKNGERRHAVLQTPPPTPGKDLIIQRIL